MTLPILLIFIFSIPPLLLTIDFLWFLFKGNRLYNGVVNIILSVLGMFVVPIVYLAFFDPNKNDCCYDTAAFSPDHKLTVYVMIGLVMACYFYSFFKSHRAGPLVEAVTSSLLLFGFVLNIFIGIQAGDFLWLFGSVPVAILIIFQLIDNHGLQIDTENTPPESAFEKFAWRLLTANVFSKFPLLMILSLPVVTIVQSILLLFGQKPDSIVRAFTDTYKHGFSQLDHLCENVSCGGHFLCSVAANGHTRFVNPVRYGERNGSRIICNRQLLIANAFEELIEQRFPTAHRFIRKCYNRVGDKIHRHYHVFNNKYVADIVYLIMKPLEGVFLFVLYCHDVYPETRIARQYLSRRDRSAINKKNSI